MHNKIDYQKTAGIIKEVAVKGLDFPTVITVEYIVNGTLYELKESIKLQNQVIKFLFLPIGQKRVPSLKDTHVGSEVAVLYDPTDPHNAFLPDNKGKYNI